MLTLNHLSAGYGETPVLQDVSISLEPGKIYLLLGKNGCGKSTLLKACAGLLPGMSGEIMVAGRPLFSLPPKERARKIAYFAQHHNSTGLTAERLVLHGRHPYQSSPGKIAAADWQAVEQAMEQMQIASLRSKRLDTLSGGQQQRVYLAMLLAQNTPVLLLDEPTTYMDIQHQILFLEHLCRLRDEGRTILLVLHDLHLALRYGDWLFLLEEGRIIHEGSPHALTASGALSQTFGISVTSVEAYGRQQFDFSL